MTVALVAHRSDGSPDGNGFTSAAIDTTGANFLVVGVGQTATNGVLTDSKGNTWVELVSPAVSGLTGTLWYAENAIVGTGHTFSISGSGNFPSMEIAAFSGVATSSSLDQQNGNAGTGNPIATGSVTPTTNDQLVVTAVGGFCSSLSIDGGFTISDSVDIAGGAHYGSGLAYLIQTTAAAANPSWTGVGGAGTKIATFKAATGGGGGTVIPKTTTEVAEILDAIVRKVVRGRVNGEALSVDEGLVRNRKRQVFTTETLSVSDVRIKLLRKLRGESLSLSESTIRKVVRGRVQSETLVLVDTIVRYVLRSRTLTELLDAVDSFSKSVTTSAITRLVSESLHLTDADVSRAFTAMVSQPIVLVDSIIKNITYPVIEGVRVVSETVAITDADVLRIYSILATGQVSASDGGLPQRALAVIATANVQLSDGDAWDSAYIMEDMLSLSDERLKLVRKTLSDIISVDDGEGWDSTAVVEDVLAAVDSVGKTSLMTKLLSETLEAIDSVLHSVTLGGGPVTRVVTEVLSLVDQIVSVVSGGLRVRVSSEELLLIDDVTAARRFVRQSSESLEAVDSLDAVLLRATLTKTLTEVIALSDSVSRALMIHRERTETVSVSDAVMRNRRILRDVIDGLSVQDSLALLRKLTRVLNDSVTIGENVFFSTRVYYEFVFGGGIELSADVPIILNVDHPVALSAEQPILLGAH